MLNIKKYKVLLTVLIFVIGFSGCISKWKSVGSININMKWSENNEQKRVIPAEANTIVVRLYSGTEIVKEKIISRTIGAIGARVEFDNLRLVPYLITIEALNGSQVLARGKSIVYIKAGSNSVDIELSRTLDKPIAYPKGGTYYTEQQVRIEGYTALVTTDSIIRYTNDGTDPNINSPICNMWETITVSSITVIKAAMFDSTGIKSDIMKEEYILKVKKPEIISGSQNGKLICTIESISNSSIRFTVDGTTPTALSAQYIQPFEISGTTTVKAIALREGWETSDISFYSGNPIYKPVAYPRGGLYDTEQKVQIIVPQMYLSSTAAIRYTTNGALVTIISPIYEDWELVSVNESMTIRAAVFDENGKGEEMVEKYELKVPDVEMFTTTIDGKILCNMVSIAGAEIFYTKDGTVPTILSLRYSAPFEINETTMVKAAALKKGWTKSDIVDFTYTPGIKTGVPIAIKSLAFINTTSVGIYYNVNAETAEWGKAIEKIDIINPDSVTTSAVWHNTTAGIIAVDFNFDKEGLYYIKVYAKGYTASEGYHVITLPIEGVVFFDNLYYKEGDVAKISVVDFERNLNPMIEDKVTVKINSTINTSHQDIILIENGKDSNEFNANVEFGKAKTGAAEYFHQAEPFDTVNAYYDSVMDATGNINRLTVSAIIQGQTIPEMTKYVQGDGKLYIYFKDDIANFEYDFSKLAYNDGVSEWKLSSSYYSVGTLDALQQGNYYIDTSNKTVVLYLNAEDISGIEKLSAYDAGGAINGGQDIIKIDEGGIVNITNGLPLLAVESPVKIVISIDISLGIDSKSYALNQNFTSDDIYMNIFRSNSTVEKLELISTQNITTYLGNPQIMNQELNAGYYIAEVHIGNDPVCQNYFPVSKFWFKVDKYGETYRRGERVFKGLYLPTAILVGAMELKLTNSKNISLPAVMKPSAKIAAIIENNGTNIEKEPINYLTKNITNSAVWYSNVAYGAYYADDISTTASSLVMMKSGYLSDIKNYIGVIAICDSVNQEIKDLTGYAKIERKGSIIGKDNGNDYFVEDYIEVDLGSFPLMLESRTGDVSSSTTAESIKFTFSKNLSTDSAINTKWSYSTTGSGINMSFVEYEMDAGLPFYSSYAPFKGTFGGYDMAPVVTDLNAVVADITDIWDVYGNNINPMYYDAGNTYMFFNVKNDIVQYNMIYFSGQNPLAGGLSEVKIAFGQGLPDNGKLTIKNLYNGSETKEYSLKSAQPSIDITDFDLHGRFEAQITFDTGVQCKSKKIYFSVP